MNNEMIRLLKSIDTNIMGCFILLLILIVIIFIMFLISM
jgi:hypothetical protein